MSNLDLLIEDVISVSVVPQHLPGRPSRATVHRWCTKGLWTRDGKVFLETITIGRQRFTSIEALTRFLKRSQRHSHTAA